MGKDTLGILIAQAEEVEIVSGVVGRALGLECIAYQPVHHTNCVHLPGHNLLH